MPTPPEHTQFQKGTSGNPKGRPRKFVSLLASQGYTRSEINDTLQAMMSMTIEELAEVYKEPKATILEKTVANAMKKSLEKGTLYSLETLLSRVYGQPKQEVAASITPQPIWQGVKLQVDTDNDRSQD
jgi:hypothetical protein